MTIEYLAPGVYIEEMTVTPRPIEGVSTSTRGFTGVYAHALMIPAFKPAWTDPNRADPGRTLVDVLAWLAELALYRLGGRPRSRVVNVVAFVSTEPFDAERVAAALGRLQGVACNEDKSGVSVSPGLALDSAGNAIEPDDGGRPAASQRVGVRRKKDP